MGTTASRLDQLPTLHAKRVEIARRIARARMWEEVAQRDLCQLGLTPTEAQTFIDGVNPRRMSLEDYLYARHIVDVRRDVRSALSRYDTEADPGITEDDLLHAAARDVAAGADPFTVKGRLTVELALRGLPELLLPFHRDMGFWESLDDEKAHYDYLRSLPRADLPTIEE